MKFSVMVRNESQLKVVKQYPVDLIYTDNLELALLYPQLYYQVPKNYDKTTLPRNLLISDLGLLNMPDKNIITDYSLNVANERMISFLFEKGVKKVTLSLELSKEELRYFSSLSHYNVEVLVYGRVIDMLLKSHPLIKENGYVLEDMLGHRYPVLVDSSENVLIYHFEPICKFGDISHYLEAGVCSFRFDFLFESALEVQSILEKFCQDFTLL